MRALLTKLSFVLSIGLQIVILLGLILRRLRRRLPWFLIYIAYELTATGLRFGVAGNEDLYFKVYWSTAIGGVLLSVMAVLESFLNVFWVYTRFRWFTGVVWGCVGLVLLYVAFRAWASPPVHASRTGAIIVALELALNYSLALVGILYFLLVRFEKIKQYQWESGIISGFMTIGIVSAVGALARSVFGLQAFSQWAAPAAYLLAEIEWALVLSQPERETPKWVQKRELTIDDLTRLDQYIKALERILGRH